MHRPIIVGMNNPGAVDHRYALYPLPEGCAGNRLYRILAEVEPAATMFGYTRRFERLNLVIGPWDAAKAATSAAELVTGWKDRRVVLLGREVAVAFFGSGGRRFDAGDAIAGPGGCTFYLLPHPSGRNLRYNDPGVRLAAGRVLAQLYRESMGETT